MPFFLMGVCMLLLSACSPDREQQGAELSRTYCASCHVYPEPSLLDKRSWFDGVLPSMGPRLGMTFYRAEQYMYNTSDALVPKGLYPKEPVMSQEEWELIVEYMVHHAPDSLTPAPVAEIPVRDDQFEVLTPEAVNDHPATTAWIEINAEKHQVELSSGTPFLYEVYDQSLRRVSKQSTTRVLTGRIHQREGGMTALLMGQLTPNDVRSGQLQRWKAGTGAPDVWLDSLERPVDMQVTDLNGDGRQDYLICNFGNFTGSLAWYEENADASLKAHPLRQLPGAMMTRIVDVNQDSKPDILALMAQGDEGIYLFVNAGDGKFESRPLLRFSPVYGSTSIEVADMNGDGHLDIVYTCGDNADYSKVLKPYHGVYVYLNDGQWNFSEKYFFPVNGCFKAQVRDFDLDGDIDIATIAYFPDFVGRPKESFVLLTQTAPMQFDASTVSCYAGGHWLTMDAGDLDGDGDEDIVLGNMSLGPVNMPTGQQWRGTPSFYLLRNRAR